MISGLLKQNDSIFCDINFDTLVRPAMSDVDVHRWVSVYLPIAACDPTQQWTSTSDMVGHSV